MLLSVGDTMCTATATDTAVARGIAKDIVYFNTW